MYDIYLDFSLTIPSKFVFIFFDKCILEPTSEQPDLNGRCAKNSGVLYCPHDQPWMCAYENCGNHQAEMKNIQL